MRRDADVKAMIALARCFDLEITQGKAEEMLSQIDAAITEYKLRNPERWEAAEKAAQERERYLTSRKK